MRILLCTVGGSCKPIVEAIKGYKYDYIYFICSRDGASKGSYTEIESKGNISKKEGEYTPSISIQCSLKEDSYKVEQVYPDNPDDVVKKSLDIIRTIKKENPDADITVNYTGGTKSMSAGLFFAATMCENIKIEITSGERRNLVKVDADSHLKTIKTGNIKTEQEINKIGELISIYAYDEACSVCDRLLKDVPDEFEAKIIFIKSAAKGFDEWDKFNHKEALNKLEPYISNPKIRDYVLLLRQNLVTDDKKEPAILFDLFNNALRRAKQGKYDDAVSRCYRFLEWSSQFLLRVKYDINTSDVDLFKVKESFKDNINKSSKGKYQVSLVQSWELLKSLDEQSIFSSFYTKEKETVLRLLDIRNNSILAHGLKPISNTEWKEISDFINDIFISMIKDEISKMKIKLPDVIQLPSSLS